MQAEASRTEFNPLRQLRAPVALAVGVLVAAAWYLTWASSDLTMRLLGPPFPVSYLDIALLLALLTAMMVAMMLPSALPMVLTYRGLTRPGEGEHVDNVATVAFASAYFLAWGALALLALGGFAALTLLGPLKGVMLFAPAVVLVAAGAYQMTRTKEACLRHCRTPLGFVSAHWRRGRWGALRMGLVHAAYCVGCCWLLMLALFVVGAMSLPWMGLLSLAILVEKVGPGWALAPRAIAAIMLALGAILALQSLSLL